MVKARPQRVRRRVMGFQRGQYEMGGRRCAHISLETFWLITPPDTIIATMAPVPVPTTTNTQAVPSASVFLIKVADWDGKVQDIKQALVAAFEANDYLECIKDLQAQNIRPLSYIDNLDKVSLSLHNLGENA